MNWTEEQQAFISACRDGSESIRLEAVAGSGKTTTLVAAANVISATKYPKALSVAFNKKNALELGEKMPEHVESKTLNGLGHGAWQRYLGKRLKVDARKVGSIASTYCKAMEDKGERGFGDNWGAIKDLVAKAKAAGLMPQSITAGTPRTFMQDNADSWEQLGAKHNIDTTPDIITAARWVLAASVEMAMQGVIDFDDQLYMTCCYNAKMPRYNLIFIDEAQDLSIIQHELCRMSLERGGRVIAVGDSKQAIYGFRGAENNSMDILQREFNMVQMGLTYSFRCGQAIIQKAQEFVPYIKPSPTAPAGLVKALGQWNEEDKIHHWELEQLEQRSAVLCRNVAPIIGLGFKLLKAGIGANILGGDLGAGLKTCAKRFKARGNLELLEEIQEWEVNQMNLAKANKDYDKMDRVSNQGEALRVLCTLGEAKSAAELVKTIDQLCNAKGSISLSTIHRAKGAEWDVVYWLDPDRCPAKFAQKAAENDPKGCGWMLEQERNLQYIATTRAKKKLMTMSMKGLVE